MNAGQLIEQTLNRHMENTRALLEHSGQIETAGALVSETFLNGGKVLLAGNGGSAADAQHWAAEWVIRLNPDKMRPAMPAIALTTDTSVLTAGANDLGYDRVFARQVEALGAKGDLLIAITTSGNSPNLIEAAKSANSLGVKVLGVLGGDGGSLAPICDEAIVVPFKHPGQVQEMHIVIGHLLCELSGRAVHG